MFNWMVLYEFAKTVEQLNQQYLGVQTSWASDLILALGPSLSFFSF